MVRAGAIATSDPRATEIGAQVLRAGGNAVDASIAAGLALFVTEPHHCGPGGDAFLLAHAPGWEQPVAVDGAGAVPRDLAHTATVGEAGPKVPPLGGGSVTVPGALSLVEDAAATLGTWSLRELVAPAVALADEGFAVRRSLAEACETAASRLAADPVLAPLFVPDGVPLVEGQRSTNPALAQLLTRVGTEGARVLYEGDVARELVACVAADGGWLAIEDLSEHRATRVDPVHTAFRGRRVWQLPQPTQGPAVLHALELLEAWGDTSWSRVADAITDGLRVVGIDLVDGPLASAQAANTTYIAAVDGDGMGASLITSVFAPFGSGLGCGPLGGALHNRAAGFLLTGEPPRAGKPPHTIIPGLVTHDGGVELALGVAGGLMQAQGQVQLAVRLLVDGLAPQQAIAAPRLRVLPGGELAVEPGHPLATAHPEALERSPGDGGFGAGQVVQISAEGVRAGADPRRDGAATVTSSSQAADAVRGQG